MFRSAAVSVLLATGGLIAVPVPSERPAKALVTRLSDPDGKVRDESSAALRDKVDALPWLRRAAQSADKDTARRAAALLAPHEAARQEAVTTAIDACIRDGCVDLLTEWHQYWKPAKEEDLWLVGSRVAQAGMDLFAKSCPKEERVIFERAVTEDAGVNARAYNGPGPERFERFKGTWTIRTDRMDRDPYPPHRIRFASVAGPVRLGDRRGGQYLALGSIQGSMLNNVFIACDGDIWNKAPEFEPLSGVEVARGIIVCRSNFTGEGIVGASVLLVDGDIDLTKARQLKHNLIRASGDIRMPKTAPPLNCVIESNAKNATAPYKFFELIDVGLSFADDEEGLVVTAVKADTPFGSCGLAKGDLIRAIDDVPVNGSEQLRKVVRRAIVRQGDCLVTITRGDKNHDLPVFFPLPK